MSIIDITIKIAEKLNINSEILLDILRTKLNDEQLTKIIDDPQKIDHINKLLNADNSLDNFQKENIKQEITNQNFNKLKENIGKLQVLVLVKGLEKTKDCDGVINVLLSALNNKFETVNDILKTDLIQTGGGTNYFNKYIKYKLKYLELSK
jgi:hypothetical protein